MSEICDLLFFLLIYHYNVAPSNFSEYIHAIYQFLYGDYMPHGEHLMYDLHGLSEAKAAQVVGRAIRNARGGSSQLKFVTGRGNHVNANGKRGVLFASFPEWMRNSEYADRIDKIIQMDGHYVVYLKHMSPFLEEVDVYSEVNMVELQRAVAQDEPEALLIYAKMLELGVQVPRDLKKAAKILRGAAEAGSAHAMHEYARFWLHGNGVRQNDQEAQKWLWAAHNAGFVEATATLAISYANALPGYPYDLEQAKKLHIQAAKQGSTASMRFLGSLYAEGSSVEQSLTKSFEWYKKAADLDDAKAQYNIAVMYLYGEGTHQSSERSEHYFKLSAYNGDCDAQFLLAKKLLSNDDKEMRKQGVYWLVTAGENGNEAADDFYLRQFGKDQELLERSAYAGNLHSVAELSAMNGGSGHIEDIPLDIVMQKFAELTPTALAMMSVHGCFALIDSVLLRAKLKFKREATQYLHYLATRYGPAERRLANYYFNGNRELDIAKDVQKALDLLSSACSHEDPIAMCELALFYCHGTHVKKSTEQAYLLLRQAADAEYPPAYYHLAKLEEAATFPNYKKALRLYQKAIDYEHKDRHLSQFIMGPLDKPESVAKLAFDRIAIVRRLQPDTSVRSFSGLKRGFFQAPAPKSSQQSAANPIQTDVSSWCTLFSPYVKPVGAAMVIAGMAYLAMR